MTLTNEEEVGNIIMSLKNNSSVGIDEIPTKLIKLNVIIFAKIICYLINKTIKDAEYPEIFKTGKIIPIHKKGDKTDMNNYRPISILSNIGEIFDKVIYIRLT